MTSSTALALIVAGPTCSGKSALALELAERLEGTVINADSMQVYADLRVITARPPEADLRRAPHRLYGVLDAAETGSVAWWRKAALAALDEARAAGRVPIFCGGTGLYLRALTQGLADIPDPGADARIEARALLEAEGAPALHARLTAVDPQTAATLNPADGQRIARAWEVWRGTGRGLLEWRRINALPPAPGRFATIRLDPPRDVLREAIAARFAAMLAAGAEVEVARLALRELDPALPAMRAHGVPELLAARQGAISLAEAEDQAVLATGRYTKRQATWFRHQALTPPALTEVIPARWEGAAQLMQSYRAKIETFIQNVIDGTALPA
ncbi:tRNA (adenosine(37)-N6)-dimethylallyltransferase MiaA [Tanticharoenia sakaeratensis]|uniref:tRNA dimethylallyltransferase n=1 Tax=Tanticharoenia sakaeratensis NBRC 103193 TaxID=1231623 RepID=A0A0D6MPY6_9PROT|nr:tRNA (adenosine(37)-N6)-dimethylallyltransferase MiaA [Tanticharoenia sakaeratensis]GAN55739.1 tRNA delta(2)-isopentenylpyrophosphate transferase [Tanticharoenia sakaeratensis NBRC 103193]GBQ18502.1 tRNA isopentenyltransferase [Tanticharoenia sakaeratensis NBRC 103193]